MSKETLEVPVIICDNPKGYFYRLVGGSYNILVNGEPPKSTFDTNWFFSETEISSIQKKISGRLIGSHWKIKDSELVCDKIPEILTDEEVFTNPKLLYNQYEPPSTSDWKPEYQHLASLYEYVPVYSDDRSEDIPFQCNIVVKAECIKEPSERTKQVKFRYIKTDDFKAILYPAIYNDTNSELYLSPQGLYNIIREEVKHKIDHQYAFIDSDHDFVFRVSKKIKLYEPHVYKKEMLNSYGKSYAKKRFETREITHAKDFEVLAMSPDVYREYQAIPGVWGENEDDLWNKVDAIVDEIVRIINTPAEQCPHCKGTGVINAHANINIGSIVERIGGKR